MVFGLFNGGYEVLVFVMAGTVHEEVILPVASLRGPGCDTREVYPVAGKYVQYFDQCASLVRGGEHYTRLVVSGTLGGCFGDHEESRHVIGVVLDILEDDFQIVMFGSHGRTDSS